MFLGWVFNVLIIAFTSEFAEVKGFKRLFWFLQFCVLGMLISFPLQGYGTFSIAFSTLHTFAALAFIIQFFRITKTKSTIALTLAKAALLYFALSSIGPFFLGYLKANALDHLNLYRYSIYFYLHFQYNGFFLFGVLSLLFKLFEDGMPNQDIRGIDRGCYILIACCLPAYFLSILWAQPSLIFNIIGFSAASLQIIGLCFFITPIQNFFRHSRFTPTEKLLFFISFFALALKSILQLISALPAAALFANEYRSIVIAYLHLVLLGGITFFLLAWLIRKRVIKQSLFWAICIVVVGFTVSEIMLIMLPWNSTLFHMPADIVSYGLLLFSTSMVLGIGLIVRPIFPPR
jgi:hypothetical protein